MDFLTSLKAMYILLDECKVEHWKKWIMKDMDLWERSKDVSHHLSAYGGMGSLNDVWICEDNGHNVKHFQEPWINNTFNDLKAICFSLAKGHEVSLSIPNNEIQGWRCLQCGYSELTKYEIDCFISKYTVRHLLVSALNENKLEDTIREIIKLEINNLLEERESIANIAITSGIKVTERDGWLRPCPSCTSNNTAVYRWIKLDIKHLFRKIQTVFKPSNNNLPLV